MGSEGGRRRSPGAQKRRYQRSILIVCEGRNTEPLYFRALLKCLRLSTTIEVKVTGDTRHTDPAGLLEDAVNLREERTKESAQSNVLIPYDDVWIVFDTEWPGKHLNLPQAINEMQSRGFRVAISKPSFETWFLLHDRPTPPGCACCDDAVKALKKVHADLAKYGKDTEATKRCVEWCLSEGRLARALTHGHAQAEDGFSRGQPELPIATATSVHRLVKLLVDACDDAPIRRALGLSDED